jgi:hypothetical protein
MGVVGELMTRHAEDYRKELDDLTGATMNNSDHLWDDPRFPALRSALADVLIGKGVGDLPDNGLVWQLAYRAMEVLASDEIEEEDTNETRS